MVALGLCAAALAACFGESAFASYVWNKSDGTLIVTYAPDMGGPFSVSWVVPPLMGGAGPVEISLVGWRGEAIVMTADCTEIGRVTIGSDRTVVEIEPDGEVHAGAVRSIPEEV